MIISQAVKIVDQIKYDFSVIERRISPLSRLSWVARSIYFDRKIEEFLQSFPDGTIINIGCGFDTTYERVQNGKAKWYELDFPEVIETRKQLIKETPNRVFLPYSVFDKKWYAKIAEKENVMVMMAGVIYYFQEAEVRSLFTSLSEQFGNVEVVFDYCSVKGIEIANKKVIENGGMDKSSYLKWGIDSIRDIERWDSGISVHEDMKMFADHRKRYPLLKRFGMWISDALSIMSLAMITIRKY